MALLFVYMIKQDAYENAYTHIAWTYCLPGKICRRQEIAVNTEKEKCGGAETSHCILLHGLNLYHLCRL